MLLLVSTNAFAEWTWVGGGGTADDEFTVYADLQTIHKKGSKVKMWTLFDYKKERKFGDHKKYLSARNIDEFDCVDKISKSLAGSSAFSDNMGYGEIIYTDMTQSNTMEIPPGSIIETFFKVACGKRK